MCCLGVVCKEHQKVQIFYPSFPPQYLFHSFKAVSSPPTDLSLFPLLKPLIYSALLPPLPPAARGSCSNCCSSGDTVGKVSLSETQSPAGLFSPRNVYHKIHLYSIFTQKCSKTTRKKEFLPAESEALAFLSKFETFCNYHIPHREWWVLRRWNSSGCWW